MTDHPITPPPKLVARWKDHWFDAKIKHINLEDYILAQAAQWGSDQELEACCEWVGKVAIVQIANNLRADRRPKPPSLKEQALEALNQADEGLNESEWQQRSDTIRRALEQLND
jgi:hypothetical protein